VAAWVKLGEAYGGLMDDVTPRIGSLFACLFGESLSQKAYEQYINALEEAKSEEYRRNDELYSRVSDWQHSAEVMD